MPEHREEEFVGQRVLADGNDYIGCTFRDCIIVYSATAPTRFLHNTFDRGVDIAFTDGATNTVKFLASLCQNPNGGRNLAEGLLKDIGEGTGLD